MTKKDYERAVAIIHRFYKTPQERLLATSAFEEFFLGDNPRFDPTRFRLAAMAKAKGGGGAAVRLGAAHDADLYHGLKNAGVPLDHHESDLYALVTPQSSPIVKASGRSWSTFVSNVDGKRWFDIPFAYTPFWDKKRR